ncbi:restriction endonuclease subunit S [Pseudonocardia sp. KRD291]|uniref:restriction endonuclease subunit S n=1 Tax=Pseudonocardia sp. KRD291 TaxID=2792007 RepID=UPI001C4A1A5F|nr:restriction endonuclease subunit S [Pseudonocardia sp. KRD291]MBW0101482.1 restriction endonuclease subunit S [Pseudonocardia sp. KRD291]
MKQILDTPLGECCEVISGATPKSGVRHYWDGEIHWATPKDLSKLTGMEIGDTPRKITEAGLNSCAATVLPAGSVLLSSRAPIGHVAINSRPMATNQGFKSLIPKSNQIDAHYLAYWLKANRSHLQSLGNGATFKEISKTTIAQVEIPLPSYDEQRRIAAILGQTDAIRTKRRNAVTLLDDLIRSIFLDMFGDPSCNATTWPIRKIGDLIESTQYGTSEKAKPEGDLPMLRMGNVSYTGEIDLSDLKYTDRDATNERHIVHSGDVLFNRTNSPELVGKSAIYRGDLPLAYAGYLIRVRANSQNNGEYLAAFLNTSHAKRVLRNMCKSIVGMANINARELKEIDIAEVPLALQREFAARVGELERFKVAHRAHLAELDALFISLQHRAFRGELWDSPAA